MANPAPALGSVDNALQVLELLGSKPQLRVVDVADHLGVARSTAHRVLSALLQRGFVVQDASRTYRAGPAFERVKSNRQSNDPDLVRLVVHRNLVQLSAQLRETCSVGVLEGNGVRFIDAVEFDHALRISGRVGILLPAHLTAIGVVMLSELTHDSLHALYPRGLGTSKEMASVLHDLERKILAARRNGYARNNGEHSLGINTVAMALRHPNGQAFAGVSVPIPTPRFEPRAVPALVQGLNTMVENVQAELRDEFATGP